MPPPAQSRRDRLADLIERLVARGTDLVALRAALCACLAATVVITWPLWQARTAPASVPITALPDLPTGVAVLLATAAVLRWPVRGWWVLVAVVSCACAMDQTRLQPEVVSLVALIGATLPSSVALVLGRAHIISLWGWAGLNKVLSTGWSGQARFAAITGGRPGAADLFEVLVPATEIAVAVLLVHPRTRRLGVAGAVAMSAGVLLTFSPLTGDGDVTNLAIWPWNVGLLAAAVVLFGVRRSTRAPDARHGLQGRRTAAAAAAIVLFPAAAYLGLVDAYLAHHLYSGATARAEVCEPAGWCRRTDFGVRDATRVPVPPQARIYRALFDDVCLPGQVLRVTTPRPRGGVGTAHGTESWLCPVADIAPAGPTSL